MRFLSFFLYSLTLLSATERPNVIVMMADDLSNNDLAPYGGHCLWIHPQGEISQLTP